MQAGENKIKLCGNCARARTGFSADPKVLWIIKGGRRAERVHELNRMPIRVRFQIIQSLETVLMCGAVTSNQHIDCNNEALPQMVSGKRKASKVQGGNRRLSEDH